MEAEVTIDFCGEAYVPTADAPFRIGREGDLVIDEKNPFLHRSFLVVTYQQGMWWLTNNGSTLTATVSDIDGAMQAWLAPGASLPLVFSQTRVMFSAGSTTYDFDIHLSQAQFQPVALRHEDDGSVTMGRVSLTPDQRLLIVALCEPVLRRGERGSGPVPQSAVAAERLGWSLTKFNRKLDNVCEKLADMGVRGLHGGPTRVASTRKARLVEYALSARVVSVEDLELLP
jgi:hypothetical protein